MVRDLRRRCPWDRVQTRETIRPYLIEEVFELDHALAEGEPDAIREEVADLLLHLGWQLVLAEERAEFTAAEVADDLERKMQRRHPHLFDLGPAERWERLKRKEKPHGVLAGLPPALPSLLMAYRLQERAAGVGFDWPDCAGPLAKVEEELAEVQAALGADNRDGMGGTDGMDGTDGSDGVVAAGEAHSAVPSVPSGPSVPSASSGEPTYSPPSDELVEEIGDLLFAVVNLARKARVQPATALDRANAKFRRRFEAIERLAAERGIDVTTAGLEVLDGLWDEVKTIADC
jgi:uncharacterized protein YabN with tetrapyrrole methylase and pyrophosphatase domain